MHQGDQSSENGLSRDKRSRSVDGIKHPNEFRIFNFIVAVFNNRRNSPRKRNDVICRIFSRYVRKAGIETGRVSDPSTPEVLRDTILAMNIVNSVFVDCTASKDVAALYQSLLEHNVSIIAANKIAASSEYENYEKLKKTAIQRGVVFRFETNVGAGLPIIGTINDLRNSGDKILKIEAVLSGTLNFIFNAISSVVPFSETVRLAKIGRAHV